MYNSVSLFVLSLQLLFHVLDFSFTMVTTTSISAEISLHFPLWLRDVPRVVRTLTSVNRGCLLPSGLCSSVPFFALPSFSLLGHGTFRNCCCLFHFRQSTRFRRRARRKRDTRCMDYDLKEAMASDGSNHSSQHSSLSSSSIVGKSSRFPLFIHRAISLFTPHSLGVLCKTFASRCVLPSKGSRDLARNRHISSFVVLFVFFLLNKVSHCFDEDSRPAECACSVSVSKMINLLNDSY